MGVYAIYGPNRNSIGVGRYDYVRWRFLGRVVQSYALNFTLGGKCTRLIEWSLPRRPNGSPRQHKLHYQHLDFTNFETRLLKIQRYDHGPQTSLVCCEIVHASVVDPPNYVALSYCWGDPRVTAPIVVDRTTVQVTVNLAEALHMLRERDELLVWADALCINQNDLYERSYQVQRMGQIYSKAKKVVSWLGHGRRSAVHPFPGFAQLVHRKLEESDFLSSEVSRHARRIGNHAYWRRVWIIQEVSKATHVEVWYEGWTANMDLLLDFFLEVIPRCLSKSGGEILESLRRFRRRERQSHIAVARMLLSESLFRSRMSLATDPRDKIYALLSMTLDGNEVVPTPNYRQDVQDVYIESTKAMIVNQGQTALMLLAKGNRALGCSWAPDWFNLTHDISPWIENAVLKERETLKITTRAHHYSNIIGVSGTYFGEIGTSSGHQIDCSSKLPGLNHYDMPKALRRHPSVYRESLVIMLELWNAITLGSMLLPEIQLSHLRKYGLTDGERRTMALASLLLGLAAERSSILETWLERHKNIYIHHHRLEQWVESHFRNALRHRWNELTSATARRLRQKPVGQCFKLPVHQEIEALEAGLHLVKKYHMRIVVPSIQCFAVVCEEAQTGDHIYVLENCSLAVVLRPSDANWATDENSHTFIGEVAWPKPNICDCESRRCGLSLSCNTSWRRRARANESLDIA